MISSDFLFSKWKIYKILNIYVLLRPSLLSTINFSIKPTNYNIFLNNYFQEEPYIMLRIPEFGEYLSGNDRFEGYCKDLANLIARKLGINCKYRRLY